MNMLRHMLIKFTKIKDKKKISKATREKQQIRYKGIPIRLSAVFKEETLQARREWHDNIQNSEMEKLATKDILPSKSSF